LPLASNHVADQKAAECSIIIKHLCTYFGRKIIAREVIPLPNVTGTVLHKVLEWCEHHKNDHITGLEPSTGYERRITTNIDEWDQKFFAVDQEMLFEIIHVRFSLSSTHLLP
jgi:S-phase kinase-associated protein 1